jgi:hypothetical protein
VRGTWSRRTNGRTGTTEESDQRQSCKRNPERRVAREETPDAPGRQHSHKEPRPKPEVTPEEQEDIRWDLPEDFHTSNHEEIS